MIRPSVPYDEYLSYDLLLESKLGLAEEDDEERFALVNPHDAPRKETEGAEPVETVMIGSCYVGDPPALAGAELAQLDDDGL